MILIVIGDQVTNMMYTLPVWNPTIIYMEKLKIFVVVFKVRIHRN